MVWTTYSMTGPTIYNVTYSVTILESVLLCLGSSSVG